MSNLIPLAPYQRQRDIVARSLARDFEVYPDRGPKPGPIVRPFPVVEPPTYRPAA